MPKQTPKNQELSGRAPRLKGRGVYLFGIFALFVLLFVSLVLPSTSSAATADTINFQARLEQANGAVVPDGSYNVEFKLYDSCSATTTNGACTTFTGNVWTEDWLNSSSNGIAVHNGYLTASLGSITAFPSTINWNQPLWLTINIGGTANTTTPTWDGQMTPALQLTAVPYAFASSQLDSSPNATGYQSSLSLVQPASGVAANEVFSILDQGTGGSYNICVQGTAATTGGCAPTTGGTGYIQNTTTQQTANFNISGTGIAATLQGTTSVLTPTLDTPTAGALAIGPTNATSITLWKSWQ